MLLGLHAPPCIVWAELPSLASPLSNSNDIASLQLNQISRSTLCTLQDEGREITLVPGCYELNSVPQIHIKYENIKAFGMGH